jgi:nicotinamide riboside kinase
MGQPSDAVRQIAASRRYDLYIVTDAGIPFVQDDIRDSEPLRQWMQERFVAELTKMRNPMIVVSGPHEERFAAAMSRIDELLR